MPHRALIAIPRDGKMAVQEDMQIARYRGG